MDIKKNVSAIFAVISALCLIVYTLVPVVKDMNTFNIFIGVLFIATALVFFIEGVAHGAFRKFLYGAVWLVLAVVHTVKFW